jgi:hypothetical protein
MNDNEPNTYFGRAQAEAELMIGGRFGGSATAPRDPAEGVPGQLSPWQASWPDAPDPLGYSIEAVPQSLTVAPDGNEWLEPEPEPECMTIKPNPLQPCQPITIPLPIPAPSQWRRR